MGNLDLVLSNGLAEDHREENLEGLKVAMRSGALLISIIEDILDLSKIEAGQLDISCESFSIAALIDQTMQLACAYQVQRKKSHLELRQDVAELPSEFVYGDQFRLQQVLVNLMSNAIKFTNEGHVSLTVMHADGNLSFCIQDTGKGIPEEKLSIIFDPFRQVELSDTREHGGTGLGLTICRKLVELMGGTLTVESQISGPKQGSKFNVNIPLEAAQDKPLNRGHNSRSSLQRAPSICSDTGIYQKVLIAEDDPVSRRVVSKMLEKAGQDFLVAKNGLEAVEMFGTHGHEISLILMDVMMPEIDGLEASKRIRRMEDAENSNRRVPIIALSAGAMKGDKEKGMEYGMTDYLTKPISYKSLIAMLETHLGGSQITA
jgi:CheY-like chemotaxis protein